MVIIHTEKFEAEDGTEMRRILNIFSESGKIRVSIHSLRTDHIIEIGDEITDRNLRRWMAIDKGEDPEWYGKEILVH